MQNIFDNQELIEVLKSGGIIVIPTDTIYGIVCSALDEKSVLRLYEIRKRNPSKPCIILISDISEIENFGISLSDVERKNLLDFFALPKPTSIIIDCEKEEYQYLHRGTNTLSFRIPKNENLKNLLKITGPLIAPSANTEGNIPAKNIKEAKEYFGDQVSLYIDRGEILANPSKIIKLNKDGSKITIRD